MSDLPPMLQAYRYYVDFDDVVGKGQSWNFSKLEYAVAAFEQLASTGYNRIDLRVVEFNGLETLVRSFKRAS